MDVISKHISQKSKAVIIFDNLPLTNVTQVSLSNDAAESDFPPELNVYEDKKVDTKPNETVPIQVKMTPEEQQPFNQQPTIPGKTT